MGIARPGLMGKTVLAATALAIGPFALLPYLISLNHVALRDQVLRTHALAARTMALRAEALLDSYRGRAEALRRGVELAGDPRSPAGRDLLSSALQAQPDLAAVAVVDDDGREVIRAQNRDLADAAAALLPLPTAEGPVAARDSTGRLWVRIELPLAQQGGRVRLVASGDALQAAARHEELGAESALVLAASDGSTVAGSAADLTLGSFPADLVATARRGLTSGAGIFGAERGEPVLAAHAPVAGSGWFVLSRQPARVAEGVARRMRRDALIGLTGAAALVALVAGAAYRSVVRPLRALLDAQERLAGRPSEASRRQDELHRLRTSLALIESEAADRAELGEVFLGRYQVLAVVGRGGMGTVFRGWDPKLQRPVALKTIRLSGAPSEAGRTEGARGLLREAVAAARLSHPNIVSVYDVEDAPDAAFIAMEFVDGHTLAALLRETPRPALALAAHLGAAIARGLAAAHQAGVVHRDLKPANVLVGREGSVKITDFGIAEFMSMRAQETHQVFGTPGYVAPEVLEGDAPEPSADLFALGVILYECLAGGRLFTGADVSETCRLTAELDPPPLRAARPEVPAELEALVARLLQKVPARRAGPALEVAEELEDLSAANGWRWAPPLERRFTEGVEDLDDWSISCLVPTGAAVAGSSRRGGRGRG